MRENGSVHGGSDLRRPTPCIINTEPTDQTKLLGIIALRLLLSLGEDSSTVFLHSVSSVIGYFKNKYPDTEKNFIV